MPEVSLELPFVQFFAETTNSREAIAVAQSARPHQEEADVPLHTHMPSRHGSTTGWPLSRVKITTVKGHFSFPPGNRWMFSERPPRCSPVLVKRLLVVDSFGHLAPGKKTEPSFSLANPERLHPGLLTLPASPEPGKAQTPGF